MNIFEVSASIITPLHSKLPSKRGAGRAEVDRHEGLVLGAEVELCVRRTAEIPACRTKPYSQVP